MATAAIFAPQKCAFSGFRIYPGKGRIFVQKDCKSFKFMDSKSESLWHMKRNPRRISWTAAYRHAHKKGLVAEKAKRKTRRTQKAQRAIVGMNIEALRAKRNQTKSERQAQRELALREIKDKKASEKAKKNISKNARAAHEKQPRQQKQRGKAAKGR
mmetsp:Transcript_7319/g.20820  ORF Transcript_7319/g.20820 Transcript_7319/m.20820 type:complete len:157 (-) Transcript_7319:47-517(-)|eukprot:CAMPEP_0119119554 /NCGR_PEP_ID=MMETSP1310-20130426/995_1 /TAXON_ID=464262 /ORGANISM="Genus nov. species nov., Strain RCC2339" /LENGTH=156 /DNA_ID=CAMNT_0007108997 /DNA_START=93 /DNA_END=563 /DNA_ORIENTATION=+